MGRFDCRIFYSFENRSNHELMYPIHLLLNCFVLSLDIDEILK